jgi:hypothetical protein
LSPPDAAALDEALDGDDAADADDAADDDEELDEIEEQAASATVIGTAMAMASHVARLSFILLNPFN